MFGRESLFTVLIISICPYVTLWLVTKLLPPWDEKIKLLPPWDEKIEPEHKVFDVHKLA
jgi:hypothetical protein